MPLPELHPLNTARTADSALLRSLRGERTSPLPVWFMRQAGRSLPEYRALRAGRAMLECCLDPATVVEITLQPIRRHGVDAAIFFSDIVVPLTLAGVEVTIEPGIGPVLARPVRTRADLDRLQPITAEHAAVISEAVAALVRELGDTPLIGFGGAPFTLASYLIEGGPSRELPTARAMMAADPELWAEILNWCADVTAVFIRAQVLAGASALQVFDSWAGRLAPEEYRTFAWPHSKRLFEQLSDLSDASGRPVPRIHFGLGTRAVLPEFVSAGATAIGIDASLPLDEAAALLGPVPLQGNIDAALLSAPWAEIEAHVKRVIDLGQTASGHVVNLGHGVPADTDPDVLTRVVELVHDYSAR